MLPGCSDRIRRGDSVCGIRGCGPPSESTYGMPESSGNGRTRDFFGIVCASIDCPRLLNEAYTSVRVSFVCHQDTHRTECAVPPGLLDQRNELQMTKVPAAEAALTVPDASSGRTGRSKLILLMLIVFAAGTVAWLLREELSLEKLAAREAAFRTFQVDNPVLVYVAAFAAYVVVAGLSLPGATALTLLIAWLLGFWRGMLVVSFGSTAGATVAFLLSRYFLRDAVAKNFGDRLVAFNDALQREGAFYLFTLRLIPAVPFFVINAVMGLTPLAVRKFWWVSQIGMLPGTAVYVYAGASVPKLQTLADKGIGAVFTPSQLTQILIAFALLGLFPLIVRFLMKRLATKMS